MVCCGHSSCYEFSVPFSRRRCACFLRFKPHGCFLWLCNCTDFCSSVLRRLHNDILLLVILSLLVLLCSNFLCLDAFMLISILIDCSFHSYCPCLHCFSHHYSVACFASIVVVVPVLDTRHWNQSCLFDSCYRPSRDFRLAPPFPLIVE